MTTLLDKIEALPDIMNARIVTIDKRETEYIFPASLKTEILRALRERDQAVEALREVEDQLAKAMTPQWFYHPDYTEHCEFDPWGVIEAYDLEPGTHVVEIQTARPLPSIWSVVHVLTDIEKDTMETDDSWVVHDFATKAEALATLASIEGTGHE